MKRERWKHIDGFDKYLISDQGRVRNLDTGTVLKHQYSERGGNYPFVNLYRNGKRKNVTVHSLVANHFIPKPPLIIDHIDRNRKNSNASNLEWVTHKENARRRDEGKLKRDA